MLKLGDKRLPATLRHFAINAEGVGDIGYFGFDIRALAVTYRNGHHLRAHAIPGHNSFTQ